MSDPVAALYEATGRLSALLSAGTVATDPASYDVLVASSSSSSEAAKQLAADSLPLYFHFFPAQSDAALSAYFDLLEDPSASVRLHAIKGLETLAKHNPALVTRLADVLAQLLGTDDAFEVQAVRSVLSTLCGLQRRAAFAALFVQVREADAPLRERVLEFLIAQLAKHRKALSSAALPVDEQTEVANGLKAALASAEGVSDRDAKALLGILLQLKVVKQDPNLSVDLAQIIATQARLDKDFNVSARRPRSCARCPTNGKVGTDAHSRHCNSLCCAS